MFDDVISTNKTTLVYQICNAHIYKIFHFFKIIVKERRDEWNILAGSVALSPQVYTYTYLGFTDGEI